MSFLQPGSAASLHSSAGSTKSNRARTRQYRVLSRKSQVDETLFGSPSKPAQNMCMEPAEEIFAADIKPRQNRSGFRKPKKETVQVITKDLIRNLM